jgi:hypothetical protein
MFISKNNGNSWQQLEIKDKATHVEQAVDKVIWGVKLDEDVDGGSNPDTNETIYFTYGAQPMADSFLKQCKSQMLFVLLCFLQDYSFINKLALFAFKDKFFFSSTIQRIGRAVVLTPSLASHKGTSDVILSIVMSFAAVIWKKKPTKNI